MQGNPQLEEGYLRIATEFLEALARTRIPGEARQVLDFIMRKTWGWNKKSDKISLSQLMAGTGLNKSSVCRATKKLKEMNLISGYKNETDTHVTYSINKQFGTWRGVAKKKLVTKKRTGGYENVNRGVTKKRHTINTITKENITKDTSTKDNGHAREKKVFIYLPLKDGSVYPISETALLEMQSKFPELNTEGQFEVMREWLLANPDKQRGKSQMRLFYVTWLNRKQEDLEEKRRLSETPNSTDKIEAFCPPKQTEEEKSRKVPDFVFESIQKWKKEAEGKEAQERAKRDATWEEALQKYGEKR